jgi:hypothetical protein
VFWHAVLSSKPVAKIVVKLVVKHSCFGSPASYANMKMFLVESISSWIQTESRRARYINICIYIYMYVCVCVCVCVCWIQNESQ